MFHCLAIKLQEKQKSESENFTLLILGNRWVLTFTILSELTISQKNAQYVDHGLWRLHEHETTIYRWLSKRRKVGWMRETSIIDYCNDISCFCGITRRRLFPSKTVSYIYWQVIVWIVNSKLLKRHSKAKRMAPAYSRALGQIRGVIQRIVRGRLRPGCQRVRECAKSEGVSKE